MTVSKAVHALVPLLVWLVTLVVCGCETSEGVWCCDCTCCDRDSHHEREDQPWTDCSEPCQLYCERDLGCAQPVQRAVPCEQGQATSAGGSGGGTG